jgi:putative PIN family toxin of toxin-antitoxin system
MKNKKLNVILDTNLWISFLIKKSFSKLDLLVHTGKITLLFSEESLAEFIEVVTRPKFANFISNSDIAEIFHLMDSFGKVVKVKSKVNICRDKSDNFWIELSKDGRADYLVTGDKDLLVLRSFEKTRILTITEFLKDLT